MIFKLSVCLALVASSSDENGPKKNSDAQKKDLIPVPDSEQINKGGMLPLSDSDIKKNASKEEGASKKKNASKEEGASKKKNASKEEGAKAAKAPASEACPHPPENEDYQKYQCKYKLNKDAASLTVGRDAKYVYVKAESKDARWLGVGVSKEQMTELSLVLNQKDGKSSGAKFVNGKKDPTDKDPPKGDNVLDDVKHALKDGKRISSFKFDLKKWQEKKDSGISIAFGKDDKEEEVKYHANENRFYIKFDGSDKNHILPPAVNSSNNNGKKEENKEKKKHEDGDGDETEDGDETGDAGDAKGSASRFCAISPLLLLSA